MPHAYTEDQLVEQPAIGLFAELGWQTVSAMQESFGSAGPSPIPSGRPLPVGEGRGEGRVASGHPLPVGEGRREGRVALGRDTPSEVVLLPRLRSALERLNPALPPEAIIAALDEYPTMETLQTG